MKTICPECGAVRCSPAPDPTAAHWYYGYAAGAPTYQYPRDYRPQLDPLIADEMGACQPMTPQPETQNPQKGRT